MYQTALHHHPHLPHTAMSTAQAIRPTPKRAHTYHAEPPRSPKAKSGDGKMHRRSRSGCFTCRLRRKKCDESKPVCRACRHLNVQCEYKRPHWWSHPEKRREQKDLIKDIIKTTKERPVPKAPATQSLPPNHQQQRSASSSSQQPASIPTPPSLCHSIPTDSHSDFMSRTRAASVDSHFSPDFSIETPQDIFNSTPMMQAPQWTPLPHQYSNFSSPYEVDIKTERQMFVNDVPTHKDSVLSTFSTYQSPPIPSSIHQDSQIENWVQQELFETSSEHFSEEPLNFNFFDFAHEPLSPTHQTVLTVDDCDKPLLDHFLENTSKLIYPILDVNQHGSSRSDIILPAMETNRCYLHCCLSTAALHLKATGQMQGEQIDNDIIRHRAATITELCEAFQQDEAHSQILEATLAMILFQTAVGTPDDGLPDIPWHQHFQAVTSLIEKLDLLNAHEASGISQQAATVPFNMTLASWVDIIGAVTLGRVPTYASSYREKIEASASSGLMELMGCEDRVMYLISEIACLESLKVNQQIDDLSLCSHITSLGEQLGLTEPPPQEITEVYAPSGAIRPKQLSKNITAVFRLAARIHLCSLVPDFDRSQPSIKGLVDTFTEIVKLIPTGPEGFDRSLVWPLLVAGSVTVEHAGFRKMLAERAQEMGAVAKLGTVGKMHEVLKEVWSENDDRMFKGERQGVHWRDVMRSKGLDFLLI